MKFFKKNYNRFKLYFVIKKTKRWALTCTDPLKKAMCVGMYNMMVEPYNAMMPNWIKKIEVIPTETTMTDIKSMADGYKPPMNLQA